VVEVVRQATKTTATTVYVRDNVIVVIGVGVGTRREIAKRVDRVIIVVERKLVEDVRLRLIRHRHLRRHILATDDDGRSLDGEGRGGSETTTSVVGIEIDRKKETLVVEGVTVEGATMTMMIHLLPHHHRRHHHHRLQHHLLSERN
jgi:hypothetical protein